MWAGVAAVGALSMPAFAAPVWLRTEQRVDPLGIDAMRPSLSWRSDSTARGWRQEAYQIEVASSAAVLASGKADVWNSGRTASGESIGLPYNGPALESGHRYFWRVRTWDEGGHEEQSTEAAWWEMGLLHPADWTARWIGHDDAAEQALLARVNWLWVAGGDARQVPSQQEAEFRTTVHLESAPDAAVLHALAGGTFSARVNGHETGHKDEWSSFDREDVRPFLKIGPGAAGDNEIVVKTKARSAKAPKTVAQAFAAVLEMRDQHGRTQQVVSDATWQARVGGGDWQAAQVVGGLKDLKVSVGSDRREMVPAPTRLTSGVSLLRKDFAMHGEVRSARLYVTAMGAYRTFLNGKRVGETELTPGFTDFRHRALYQTYDVTAFVRPGKNVLGAVLGAGWHGSPLLWAGLREFDGPDLLRAQLVLTMVDGSRRVIDSGKDWQSAEDATDSAEIYGGETYDARLAQTGWSGTDFKPKAGWTPVREGSVPAEVTLSAQPDMPIHISQTIQPVSTSSVPAEEGRSATCSSIWDRTWLGW